MRENQQLAFDFIPSLCSDSVNVSLYIKIFQLVSILCFPLIRIAMSSPIVYKKFDYLDLVFIIAMGGLSHLHNFKPNLKIVG